MLDLLTGVHLRADIIMKAILVLVMVMVMVYYLSVH